MYVAGRPPAVHAAPTEYRLVLVYRLIRHMPYSDCAAISQIPVDGTYSWELKCDDNCALFINGDRVLQASHPNANDVTLSLPEGQHQFMVSAAHPASLLLRETESRWAR